jgi:hypothetical protein
VKTSPKRSCSVIENERFGLVFAKTGSIISGTGVWHKFERAMNIKDLFTKTIQNFEVNFLKIKGQKWKKKNSSTFVGTVFFITDL